QGAYREALEDLERSIELARRDRNPVEAAISAVCAADLCMVGMNDRRSALQFVDRPGALEHVITYRDAYFQYWPYWGGLFKLYLLAGDVAAAESVARNKFTADKWYGPYVAAYLHAARGECAQAAAASNQVLEW